MHVDDVEAADGDALKQHRAHVSGELAPSHEIRHHGRGVRAVATHAAAHDPVEPRSGAHGADEQHVTAMRARKRSVVETDDVHVRAIMS